MRISIITACIAVCLLTSCFHRPGSTNTTNKDSASLSFIVIGDWGVKGSAEQKNVAEQIDLISQVNNVEFIITTGDNFYPAGVTSTEDPHWEVSYNAVYNRKGHMVPWYPTLGNHDYNGSPAAEIAYSKISNRWRLPSTYYSFRKKIGKASAVFAFADMNPFITSYYKLPMPELKDQDTAAQYKWLNETLSSTADWKIMIGHQPLYSVGSHGSSALLIDRFKPLLLETKTDFYLAGHDHNLQHIKLPDENPHYLVSGGGGRGLYGLKKMDASTKFAASSNGFLLMTLYPDRAEFYFYNEKGSLLYHHQVKK
jgi:tartrate-resistant acid phosphatase type 5